MATVVCGDNINQLERKQLLSGGMNETGKVLPCTQLASCQLRVTVFHY